LSFSGAYPLRQAIGELTALRRDLPRTRTIWAGGGMIGRLRRPLAGIELIPDLAGTIAALRRWRGATAASAAASAPVGNDGSKAPAST
jgi:hypothetical protein